jgi:DNA helicase II / ATP-dependent DNA helicase PcrA
MLLSEKADLCSILMTTFTEKAAFEMLDRIHQYAEAFGYRGPLHELKIGTINSFCDDVIRQFISHTPLKKNFEILDALTQNLFINDNFGQIVTNQMKTDNRYFDCRSYTEG